MKLNTVKEKLNSEKSRQTAADLGIICLIILFVTFVAYAMNGIYPFGHKSIARGDMVQQTIPAGMYYVWDVLHGKASPFFTWNSGLGMNISGAVSLGALFSPLNLLLFFSTRSYLFYYANLLLVFKMIAIACAMYFYLKKYNTERIAWVVGGVLYAFGAASLVHFQIMLVMDAAFLLPLIMIGIDRMYRGKNCIFFIVVFAVCMMVNVYTGCITLLYLFLSSGLRTWYDDSRSREDKQKWILHLGLSVVAALLLSAVVCIPALKSIGEAPRSGDGDFLNTYLTALQAKWSAYDWSTIERMCVNSALPLACIVGFLLGKKKAGDAGKYKGHIILTACMILSVIIPSIELLWHGGSRASWPVRFIYVISFVFIDFAMLLYQDSRQKKREEQKSQGTARVITGCAAVVVCLAAGLMFRNIYNAYCAHSAYATLGDGFLCLMVEAVCVGIYIFILKNHKSKAVILVVLCAQLVSTSIISFATNKENATVFSSDYLEAANNVGKSMKTELKDFERIKNTDYKIDHIEYSLVLGEEAISNYWHVINPDLQPNFSALGYSINWTQMLDAGGTIFSDTLMHVQYALSSRELPQTMYSHCEDTEGYAQEKIGLYKNNLEMPFVIQTDTGSMEADGEKFAAQNSLFQAITGSADTLIEDVSQNITGSSYQTKVGKGKKILYFYGLNTTDQQVTITVNGNPVYIPNSDTSENINYPVDFGNGLICLGSFENENVDVEFSEGVDASMLHLGFLDYDKLTAAVAAINAQNPEITSLKQKHAGVKIKLDNVTKGNVFIPISYDKGWTCKVNGKKAEVSSIDGMLSVPVEQGSDKIVLKYRPAGRTIGMVISLLTLVICVAVLYLKKKAKIKDDQKAVIMMGQAAYQLFGIVYTVFIAVLFIVPILYYIKEIFVIFQS